MSLFDKSTSGTQASIVFDTQRSQYGFIFFMGIALGFATTVLFQFFPTVMHTALDSYFNVEGKWMIVGILVLSALFSLPASKLVEKYGMQEVFWGSLTLIGISMAGVIFLSGWIVLIMAILFSLTFTTLSVSSLPLAIKNANYYEKVFCVGIFFSGVEFPEGIIETILSYSK